MFDSLHDFIINLAVQLICLFLLIMLVCGVIPAYDFEFKMLDRTVQEAKIKKRATILIGLFLGVKLLEMVFS